MSKKVLTFLGVVLAGFIFVVWQVKTLLNQPFTCTSCKRLLPRSEQSFLRDRCQLCYAEQVKRERQILIKVLEKLDEARALSKSSLKQKGDSHE